VSAVREDEKAEQPARLHAFTCTENSVPAAREETACDVDEVNATWVPFTNTWYEEAEAELAQDTVNPSRPASETEGRAGAPGGENTVTERDGEEGEQPIALQAATL